LHESCGAARRAAVAEPAAVQRDGDPHRRSVGLRPADLRPAGKRAGGHLSAVEIAPVTGGRDLERFIAFPYEAYRAHPLWLPQLRMDVRTLRSPPTNPLFQHAPA